MAAPKDAEPEIVLYDLACTKGVCFSPVVWRIRLMLNYKRVPYKTVFLEFPDIGPTLEGFGLVPGESPSGVKLKHTVPAIHHLPSNTYLMDSVPIAQFLESHYLDPAVPLTSPLAREIEEKGRRAIGPVFGASVMPREINILSPRSQEYFRRTREERLCRPLEELLNTPGKEDQSWDDADSDLRALSELLQTNKADGPFALGTKPSYVDFFIAASLQSARVVDEGVFQRVYKYQGFRDIYEACQPWMERKD